MRSRFSALSGGTAVATGVRSAGGRVFYQVRPVGADNFKLAVRQGVAGAERVLIDPTTMKSDGKPRLPSGSLYVSASSGRPGAAAGFSVATRKT